MDTRFRTPDPPLSLSAWLRYDAVERLLPRDVQRVLEIGAGLGSVGALLARRFAYTGLEPGPVSYETATERVGRAGLVLNCTAEEFDALIASISSSHSRSSSIARTIAQPSPGGSGICAPAATR